jgi:hypothetical protein
MTACADNPEDSEAVCANDLFGPNGFKGISYKSILAICTPYYFFKSKGF